ncbi:hypothetical protein [Pontiella sulfatireligans]|uniref:DUF3137 domain-containing protein n=1 Tax=Pontiella sulfatireligans TaxID=2750658 RepID=A0A6C2UM38_9BACT|nr:hypothetical protein [Pontiella sulfatireligans]VGO21332.1 hypothetical protein SCARR_03404 [Pontiella sulfatireligans]
MGGIVVVFICIIGAVIWGIMAGKKRRDAMTLLAEKLGLDFNHERNYRIAERYRFLDKLDQGSNRYAYNLMSGPFHGRQITAFDYHYETHSTDSKGRRQTHHHHFSFFILSLEKQFPELTIAKEGLLSKIAQAVGYDDIDFESHEFSKKFVVRSKNKKFAYDFCNAQMIAYLLDHPGINIEIDQSSLALGLGSCLKVEEIEAHLNQLLEIRSLIPDYVFG